MKNVKKRFFFLILHMKTYIKMQNIETSSEPKTKLNMNMQMRLLKMFVKRNIRGDIVIEKNPFSDFIDVKECQE